MSKKLSLRFQVFLSLCSLALFAPMTSHAQIDWEDIFSNLELRVAVGSNVAFPFGKDVRHLREIFESQNAFADSVGGFEGRVLPRLGFACGFEGTYPINSSWRVGIGLRYSQKGYVQKENGSFRHPEYQYDEMVRNRFIFRVNTLEIPIQMYWLPSERFRMYSGVSIGWPIKSQAQTVKHVYSKTVVINGETDENRSTGVQRETYPIAEGVRSAHLGGLLGASVRIDSHWWIQVGGQITTPLFKDPWDIYNIVAQAGVVWQL